MILYLSKRYEINPEILENDEFSVFCVENSGISEFDISYNDNYTENAGSRNIRRINSAYCICKNGARFDLLKLNVSWVLYDKKTGEYL